MVLPLRIPDPIRPPGPSCGERPLRSLPPAPPPDPPEAPRWHWARSCPLLAHRCPVPITAPLTGSALFPACGPIWTDSPAGRGRSAAEPSTCCDAPFGGEGTEAGWSPGGPGCGHSVSTAGRLQSGLQAEPAPQGAADLQAGLAAITAITAVRTPHIQLTHLPIDLRGPHSACAQLLLCPVWPQCIVRPKVSSAALVSLGLIGLHRTRREPPCSCQICAPPPSRKGSPPS